MITNMVTTGWTIKSTEADVIYFFESESNIVTVNLRVKGSICNSPQRRYDEKYRQLIAFRLPNIKRHHEPGFQQGGETDKWYLSRVLGQMSA